LGAKYADQGDIFRSAFSKKFVFEVTESMLARKQKIAFIIAQKEIM